jgi:hypothetical protein
MFPRVLYLVFDKQWCLVTIEVRHAKPVLPLDLIDKTRRAKAWRQRKRVSVL